MTTDHRNNQYLDAFTLTNCRIPALFNLAVEPSSGQSGKNQNDYQTPCYIINSTPLSFLLYKEFGQ